jgi:uncharacterized cupin superfamily protein
MLDVKVERNPDQERLQELGVYSWAIWTKEVSEFPWTYDATETCYLLEGEVLVTSVEGEQVEIRAGDLVVFPKDLSCTWKVITPVRKHYRFD